MAMNFAHQHPVDLSLLSPEDWQKLTEWNNTQLEYDQQKCIHQLIEDQVERSPAAPAILFENQRLTYQELNQQANQLAHYLQNLSVGPETLVGICMERSPKMVVALLAILKAGGAYVPLDPKYPSDRLASISEDAQFPVLITQEHLLNVLPEHQAKVVCVDSVQTILAQQPVNNPTSTTAPSNLAYVLYTSGSTGRPKGVALEHRNTVAFIAWAQHYFTRQQLQGVLASTSVCFDLSVFELFVTLSCGGKVILAQDALQLPNLSAASEVTLINTVPSAIATLLRMNGIPESVNTINLAGEPLQNALVQKLYQLGHVKQVYNLYGPTEDTTYSTAALVPKDADGIPLIGYPISNSQVYLLEEPARRQSDPLRPVPIGTPGEVYLGGAGVARGYLNQPELTAEKFLPNPFSDAPGARLYKTGDLAVYQPDGSLKYLGRIDHQVKIRGFRIELGEIEAVLNQHPEVRESVVVPQEDAFGNKELIAYVVPQTNANQSRILKLDGLEKIKTWQTIWNATYCQPAKSSDPTFNTVGWNNSVNGSPISQEEMLSYVNNTVERILSLKPQRVLEIGCGTGLLLFRIAPYCERFVGLDISDAVVDHLQKQLEQDKIWSHVTVLQRAAHQLADLEVEGFDTVIINSVVQYFPNAEYLVQVLEAASKLLKRGGKIFVGDVRNFALLEAFHTGIQVQRALVNEGCESLKRKIQERVTQDEELLIHPSFFDVLKYTIPSISAVQTHLKRGVASDELTRFRFDVILHINTPTQTIDNCKWLDWQEDQLSVLRIRELIKRQNPEILKITNVPNARVLLETAMVEILADSNCPETVAELLELAHRKCQNLGVHPEEIWAIGQEVPYSISIDWPKSGLVNAYDVTLQHQSTVKEEYVTAYERSFSQLNSLTSYTNQSIKAKNWSNLSSELHNLIRGKLPDYMLPASFVVLNSFPLTPNGKIDRRSLPKPKKERPILPEEYVEPSNSLEKQIAKVWTKVLGIEKIGIHDSFFALGGNSLLAAQLLICLEEELQIKLPLFYLLKEPTVAGIINGIAATKRIKTTQEACYEVDANLQLDSILDATIQPQNQAVSSQHEIQHIFLTGATGFLGAFILHELLQQTQATIHCLVRASNPEDAAQRLQSILKHYQLWLEEYETRIAFIPGDLSQPLFGLSEADFKELGHKLDLIIHCGASVNLIYPYTALRAANVKGTQEVLRLASQGRTTPVHYISTLDVFQSLIHSESELISEEHCINTVQSPTNGYAQSKWVAEKLVMSAQERGIPLSIYRPGMISGHSQTGVSQTSDLMCRLMKGLIQMQCAPRLEYSISLTPVDYASKAIVHLSMQSESLGKVFHILNPQTLSWNDMVQELRDSGHLIEWLAYKEWQSMLANLKSAETNALSPIRTLLTENLDDRLTYLESFLRASQAFDCKNTLRGLAGTSVVCPPTNAQLLRTYLNFFNRSGFVSSVLENSTTFSSRKEVSRQVVNTPHKQTKMM